MKVQISINPAFDFAIAEIGGLDDIPTKQDKFKPLNYSIAELKFEDGSSKQIPSKILYELSEKRREGQIKFEDNIKKTIKEHIDKSHPYKKPQQLEVVIAFNMTSKRFFEVDIDNLAKCILDCLNGLVYEDDSQIISLTATKNVIKHEFIPELSGIWIAVRKINKSRPILNNVPIFIYKYIQD